MAPNRIRRDPLNGFPGQRICTHFRVDIAIGVTSAGRMGPPSIRRPAGPDFVTSYADLRANLSPKLPDPLYLDYYFSTQPLMHLNDLSALTRMRGGQFGD
jgi:hypothetical protein